MKMLLGFGNGARTSTAKVGKPVPGTPTGLVGFAGGEKAVTAKVGGKGGPIIIVPPDAGPDGGEN